MDVHGMRKFTQTDSGLGAQNAHGPQLCRARAGDSLDLLEMGSHRIEDHPETSQGLSGRFHLGNSLGGSGGSAPWYLGSLIHQVALSMTLFPGCPGNDVAIIFDQI